MTVVFFGSDPWFSPPVLEALVEAGHDVPVVVTKGSALQARLSAIRNSQFATRKSFIVQATSSQDISKDRLETFLHQALGTRHQELAAIVLASFGPPFLPNDLLDWPTYGCLNVHASLLPRWRGASPVSAAIAAGDKETGVTIMKMTRAIDRGSILGQTRIKIRQPSFKRSDLGVRQGQTFSDEYDTRESLTRRLGVLGGELIVQVLGQIGQIRPIRQPIHSPTPYTCRLKKENGRIDWSKSPEDVERFIRAVTPWPGATTNGQWLMVNGQWQKFNDLKILKAHLEPLTINSLTHQLILDEVQLPGKNPVIWKQFLAGHPGAKFY